MGFLRFLNKGKVKVEEELDIPPIPPPPAELSDVGAELIEELPPLPELGKIPEEEAIQEPPEVYEGSAELGEEELPPLPELKKEESASWALEEGIPIAQLTKPTTAPFRGIEKTRKIKPRFVRIDSFKNNILKNMAMTKNELKNLNEILSKLGRLEQSENIIFKDLHDKMDDLQKKLMSIDKILFRG